MNKLFGNLGIGAACTVQLEFKPPTEDAPLRTVVVTDKRGDRQTIPVFTNKSTVTGLVKVTPTPGKRVEHQGIRVQLVGEIELASERGHPHEFLSLVRDLTPQGELHTQQIFPFEFKSVEMEYESYKGTQVRLRYLLRVTVVRGLGQTVTKDYPFWVHNSIPAGEVLPPGPPIKMEVGIEDCLHIEFEYDRSAYSLNDTVVGKIFFLLVRIKLKHMELEIRRRETVGAGSAAKVETETVAKYEIMDGAPVRGEVIPIRLHLAPYELTPSYPTVHNKFGVKYMLNLVLVDEEDRRYFKQQEITLFRAPAGEEKKPARYPKPILTPRGAERALSGESSLSGGGVGGSSDVGGSTGAAAVEESVGKEAEVAGAAEKNDDDEGQTAAAAEAANEPPL